MKHILLLATVALLTACEQGEDVSFWFADEPVLAEEMAERGWEVRQNVLYLNDVPVFEWSGCMRCDNTVWLGPNTGGAQGIVIAEFNVDLKAAIQDRDRRFFESIRVTPTEVNPELKTLTKP